MSEIEHHCSERHCNSCAQYRFAGSVPPCEINTYYPFLRASLFPFGFGLGNGLGAGLDRAFILSPFLAPARLGCGCPVRRFDINNVGYPWC